MKIEFEVLKRLYVEENKKQREIAIILNRTQSTVSYFCKKYKLDKTKELKEQKHWSEEDKETLMDLIGIYSYKAIANILGRTEKAIDEKRKKLELGDTRKATEYLNANELAEALGRVSNTIRNWLNNYGLPHTKRVLAKERRFYRIDVKQFWKWAKKNNDLMRWDLYKLGSLANEPKWIEEVRKVKSSKSMRRRWTKADETYLLFYYNQGFTLKEIGIKLNRTMKSIDQRLLKLNVKRKQIQLEWKKEEEAALIEMRKQGKTFGFIAEELGRSTDGVKAKNYYIESKQSLTY